MVSDLSWRKTLLLYANCILMKRSVKGFLPEKCFSDYSMEYDKIIAGLSTEKQPKQTPQRPKFIAKKIVSTFRDCFVCKMISDQHGKMFFYW